MTVYNQALFKKDETPNVGKLEQGVETLLLYSAATEESSEMVKVLKDVIIEQPIKIEKKDSKYSLFKGPSLQFAPQKNIFLVLKKKVKNYNLRDETSTIFEFGVKAIKKRKAIGQNDSEETKLNTRLTNMKVFYSNINQSRYDSPTDKIEFDYDKTTIDSLKPETQALVQTLLKEEVNRIKAHVELFTVKPENRK